MMSVAYPAIFHQAENGWWVEFPDLPGCVTEAETPAQAMAEASSALGAFLRSMADHSLYIPIPSSVQNIVATDMDFTSIVEADPTVF